MQAGQVEFASTVKAAGCSHDCKAAQGFNAREGWVPRFGGGPGLLPTRQVTAAVMQASGWALTGGGSSGWLLTRLASWRSTARSTPLVSTSSPSSAAQEKERVLQCAKGQEAVQGTQAA